MSDFDLLWEETAGDLRIANNDIARDDSLQSAVARSLFTDARADQSDILPAGQTDRRGWWGDDVSELDDDRYGSKLWLLEREKQTEAVRLRYEKYARDALQWLIDDLVTDRIEVTASYPSRGLVTLEVLIYRPETDKVEYRYNYVWDAQAARIAAQDSGYGQVELVQTDPGDFIVTEAGDYLITETGDYITYGDEG